MTTPREIIRDGIIKETGVSLATVRADAAIAALTSAGYHILSSADLAARDDAVLERAATLLDGVDANADDPAQVVRALKGGKL